MKKNFVLMAAAGLALLSATPASAGAMSPAQLDSYCWAQAERVRPMLPPPRRKPMWPTARPMHRQSGNN